MLYEIKNSPLQVGENCNISVIHISFLLALHRMIIYTPMCAYLFANTIAEIVYFGPADMNDS